MRNVNLMSREDLRLLAKQQAEQIKILSDEINYLRGNEKGRRPSCLLYFDQKQENQRLKECIEQLEKDIEINNMGGL